MKKNFLFKAFSVILLPGVLLSSLPAMAAHDGEEAGENRKDGYLGPKRASDCGFSKKQALVVVAAVAGAGITGVGIGYVLGQKNGLDVGFKKGLSDYHRTGFEDGNSTGFEKGKVFGNATAYEDLKYPLILLNDGIQKYENQSINDPSENNLFKAETVTTARLLTHAQDRAFGAMCSDIAKVDSGTVEYSWDVISTCSNNSTSAAYALSSSAEQARTLIRNAENDLTNPNDAHGTLDSLQEQCMSNPQGLVDAFRRIARAICPNFNVPQTCNDLMNYLLRKQTVPVMQAVINENENPTLLERNQAVSSGPQQYLYGQQKYPYRQQQHPYGQKPQYPYVQQQYPYVQQQYPHGQKPQYPYRQQQYPYGQQQYPYGHNG